MWWTGSWTRNKFQNGNQALKTREKSAMKSSWPVSKKQRFSVRIASVPVNISNKSAPDTSQSIQLHQPACSFCLDIGDYPCRFHCVYSPWQMQILRETKSQYLQCRLTFTVGDVVINMWNSNDCYHPWN